VKNTIILTGSGGDLELEIVNDFHWTRCYLVAEKKLLLGADVLSCVIAGLSKALGESDAIPVAGKINATNVRYAFHLEEAHHSLYYGDEADTRLLFWQADASQPITLVGIIRLSPEQCRQWRETLTATLDSHREPVAVGR